MYKDDKIFLVIVFVTFLILSVITITLIIVKDDMSCNCNGYTKEYQNITAREAKTLIASNNITVADIRGLEGCGPCQFNKGHLPGAGRYIDPKSLYNHTKDILVYSKDGTRGEWFCQQLVGHVYCDIYNMEGGWIEWSR